MRGRNRFLTVFAVLALVGACTFLFGCDWFDDDEEQTTSLSGQPLTPATKEEAAALGANTLNFFSQMGAIFVKIAVPFFPPAPQPVAPAGPAPLILVTSGLCASATLDKVTWNDVNANLEVDAGDTITVDLDNCSLLSDPTVFVSGTPNPAIKFTLTDNVSRTPPSIKGTLSLSFTSRDSVGSIDIDGIMAASASAIVNVLAPAVTPAGPAIPPPPTRLEVRLGTKTGTAANTQFTVVDVGSGQNTAFGCFDVVQTFADVNNPLNFDLSVRGVTKIQNATIMQLGDYAETVPSSLTFVNGIPISGQLKLLSFDSRANFPPLASCYGTVTGTTSELVIVTEPDEIQLDTFKNITWSAPVDNTIYTTWRALIDF